MLSMTINDFFITMACVLLGTGVIFLLIGAVVLISKIANKEIKMLADQTAKLAQKGITDDVSGLVGNATVLIDALNQMVRTAAGVGIFLICIGFILMGAAYGLVLQIH